MHRPTRVVKVGSVSIGGDHPIRVQSMTTTPTHEVGATVDQIIRLSHAGCEIVRVTVQGRKEAEACAAIKERLLAKGYEIPLVADIHFYPPAALLVADAVEKVRINPGNFADRRATFRRIEYDDETYARELERIEEAFSPLVEKCKRLKRAIRIGVNHGSLSDRILNRFGDTPNGMVQSAVEYAEVARRLQFHDLVFSMKASNPLVMIDAYRALAHRFRELGWDYPMHLGVTEAGEGREGRVKSAIGIGALLLEGIGDTIRVSLTEDPVDEIQPAREIAALARGIVPIGQRGEKRRVTLPPSFHPEGTVLSWPAPFPLLEDPRAPIPHPIPQALLYRARSSLIREGRQLIERLQEIPIPVLWVISSHDLIQSSAEAGALLADRLGEGVCVEGEESLGFQILQGVRMRITQPDYISCPGCGRTLFDLPETARRIRERTSHLKGLKIAIMGCIVNGPGEMADADFGYVGSKAGKIDLYVGKQCVERDIDMKAADERLVALIRAHGKWQEPPG